jgi:hypothetical protein
LTFFQVFPLFSALCAFLSSEFGFLDFS